MAALALTMTACSSDDLLTQDPTKSKTNADGGITITATLAPKEGTMRSIAEGTGTDAGKIVAKWATDEQIAILYKVSSEKKKAVATVKSVNTTTGAATIEFTVDANTTDGTTCTMVFPADAADDNGMKDAATLLGAQDGTLSTKLDVRKGEGTIKTTTPSLDVTTDLAPQFAIFKFTTKNMDGSADISVQPLKITVGTDSYTITPLPSATSTLYAALPAITNDAVTFNATAGNGSNHFFSKNGVTIEKGKFYQSTIKLMPYNTPLTMEALTNGTIVIKQPKSDMQYSKNGETKTTINPGTDGDGDDTKFTINVTAGDKFAFYGNGTNITQYGAQYSSDCTQITGGDAEVTVYGNIMSLVDEENYGEASVTALSSEYTFRYLFNGNTKLKDASLLLLPATTLNTNCYAYMFNGCSALTAVPALPATTLVTGCYNGMFSGCKALTAAPALPATTLAESCYDYMFNGCEALTTAPALKAETLAKYCYRNMFRGCKKLTTAPALPATTMVDGCYNSMFNGCEVLTTAPELPATTLANYCYYGMFWGCKALTTAPELKAETLAESCYGCMFWDCEALTAASELPATTLANNCYSSMFRGCKALTAAPALPATTMVDDCYNSMFFGCTALTTAPELKATTLAESCYQYMFQNCEALTAAPELKATALVKGCYQAMFNGCKALIAAPELKAETLAESCYSSMFYGCTALTTAPELKATTLAAYCYLSMFSGCTALTTAPALPATTLANQCYDKMFSGCTALTTAPELPAATLTNYCYHQMFNGCKKLSSVTCLATDITATSCLSDWLKDAGTEASEPKLYVDASMTGATWNNGSFTVTAKP